MARLILIVLLFAALAFAAQAVLGLWRSLTAPVTVPVRLGDQTMPDTIRNVAYVLLLILLVSVATGWLGA